jgi:two-component system KDP operon response regulator KdpE
MNQQTIRILVVDDEPAIRRALRPPLVELGFQVAEASRGEEALQALRASAHDVVLLDVNMPGIGGIETLRRMRAFAPRLPILMLTVRDQEEDKVEALDLGADDYVTKPFSTRELIARIRTAVRRVRAPARAEDAPIEIEEIRLDLRTFVRQLRKKIEDDPSNPLYLLTDVYVGYRFADAQMLREEPAGDEYPQPDAEAVREDAS